MNPGQVRAHAGDATDHDPRGDHLLDQDGDRCHPKEVHHAGDEEEIHQHPAAAET
jgi:hypothetical protein